MEAAGMLPGVDMASPYSQRWDPRKEWEPSADDDQGWCGEDANGVWMKRHPLVAASEDQDLWGIIAAFECGGRDVESRDLDLMSNFELEGRLTMLSAHNRQELREAREGRDGH